MAFPTAVNSQITDAVTQTNISVLGSAPAVALGTVYNSLAHAMGLMYQNNTMAQQHSAISGQASANLGVIQMYGVNSMSAAAATAKQSTSNTSDTLLALLVALAATKR